MLDATPTESQVDGDSFVYPIYELDCMFMFYPLMQSRIKIATKMGDIRGCLFGLRRTR